MTDPSPHDLPAVPVVGESSGIVPTLAPARWVRGSAWLLGGNLVSAVLTVCAGIVVARALGPPGFGVYSVVVVAVGLVSTVTTFRLDLHLATELGSGGDDRTIYSGALRAAYLLTVPACAAATAAALVWTGGSARTAALLGVADVVVAPLLLARVPLQVRARQRGIAVAAVASRLSWLVLVVMVATIDGSSRLAWIMAGRVLADAVEGAVLARFSGMPLLRWVASGGWTAAAQLAVLRRSWPLAVSGVVGTAYNRIDQILLASTRGRAETGLYAAGVRVAETLSIIPSVVQSVSLPGLAALARENDDQAFKDGLRASSLLTFLPGGLGIALLVAAGGRLGEVLFGTGYRGAGPLIAILAVAEVGVFAGTTLVSAALAMGRRTLLATSTAIGLAVNLAANGIFLPRHGAVAAAWASVAGYGAAALSVAAADRRLRALAGPSLVAAGTVMVVGAAAATVGRLLAARVAVALAATSATYLVLGALAFRRDLAPVLARSARRRAGGRARL